MLKELNDLQQEPEEPGDDSDMDPDALNPRMAALLEFLQAGQAGVLYTCFLSGVL